MNHIEINTSIALNTIELGMIVLMLDEVEAADHKQEFNNLRNRLKRQWSRKCPTAYEAAVEANAIKAL